MNALKGTVLVFGAITLVGCSGGGDGGDELTAPPVNQAPTISSIERQTVDEDAIAGPISMRVSDAETPASLLTVLASSSDPSLLPHEGIVIDGDAEERQIVLIPAAGQAGVATVTIDVMDSGGQSASTSFDVDVLALFRGEFSSWMRTVSLSPGEFDAPIGEFPDDGSTLAEIEDIPRIKFSDDSAEDEAAYDDLLPQDGDPVFIDDD